MWFTHCAGSSQIGGILLHWVRGFETVTLGLALLLTDPEGFMGFPYFLMKTVVYAHFEHYGKFQWYSLKLVCNYYWLCVLKTRVLGCYLRYISRLECELKAMSLGSCPKQIHCPCLYLQHCPCGRCRWLVGSLETGRAISLIMPALA